VSGRDRLREAASAAELIRAYGEVLAGPEGLDPWDASVLRSIFLAKRREIEVSAPPAAGAAEIGNTPEEWLGAWFDPAATDEALGEAVDRAKGPGPRPWTREGFRRFLGVRDQWFAARRDADLPPGLLDAWRERHLGSKPDLSALAGKPGMRRAAQRVKARYPGLVEADVGVLKALLAPALGDKLGKQVSLVRRRSAKKAGTSVILIVFLVLAALRLLRHCDVFEEKKPADRGEIGAPGERIGIGDGR